MPDSLDSSRLGPWSVPGYRHVRELGSGATGTVVQAVEEPSGASVAIKYLSSRLLADPDVVDRFRDEARLLESLDTPHVARLYEYVQSPTGAAIVMELVQGVSLHTLLREQGATEPEAALTLLKGSLLGLSAAHAAGVVHRDYKPANVLVDPEGCSKLVDFGIAVRQGDGARAEGTPAYMAPEQWRGEPASPATDVYAATATFFECLTGTRPYTGSTLPELAMQHVTAPVPQDRAPEALRDLIRRGMAKAPQDRPASADEFIGELEAVAVAACGEDWEERGRRRLVVMVAALLPLLWPVISEVVPGSADAATTALPQPGATQGFRLASTRPRLRVYAGAVVGAAVLALGAAVTVVAVSGDDSGGQPAAVETTGAGVTDEQESPPASPSPSDSESPSASASPSDSPSPSVSVSPESSSSSSGSSAGSGSGGGGSDPEPPESGGTTSEPPAGGAAGGSDPSPKPSPVQVKFLGVTGMSQGEAWQTAVATFEVSTDTTGPLNLTVTWYDANKASSAASPGSPDGGSQTFALKGKTLYQVSASHTFDPQLCSSHWGVLAAADPAAGTSRPYRSILAPSCRIVG